MVKKRTWEPGAEDLWDVPLDPVDEGGDYDADSETEWTPEYTGGIGPHGWSSLPLKKLSENPIGSS